MKAKMKSGVRVLSCIALALTASACGHTPIDLKQSSLMPEASANAILERYFGKEWVASPYLLSSGPCDQKGVRKDIAISDINGAVFVPSYGFTVSDGGEFKLKMGFYCMNTYRLSVGNEQSVREIGAALRARGAHLDEVYWAM